MYTKAHFDFAKVQWLKNLRKPLGLQGVGLSLIRLPAGKGYSFTHRHGEQEEVYVAIEGRGVILIEGELLDFEAGDVVRVPPEASRACASDFASIRRVRGLAFARRRTCRHFAIDSSTA